MLERKTGLAINYNRFYVRLLNNHPNVTQTTTVSVNIFLPKTPDKHNECNAHIYKKMYLLQYKQHMGVHDRWSCNFCNKTYTRRHDRDKHVEHAHSGSCIFMNAYDESGLKQKRGYCEMVL